VAVRTVRGTALGALRRASVWSRLLLQAVHLWALIVPVLRVRGIIGNPRSVIRAEDGYVITDELRAVKVMPGRDGGIHAQYVKYVACIERWPQLAGVLAEAQIRNGPGGGFMLMPRYRPVTAEAGVGHALGLFETLRTCAAPAGAPFDVSASPELTAGIEVVAGIYGEYVGSTIDRLVRAFVRDGTYSVGFAHGDFHSGNIMLDREGRARLVDFDCLRLHGLQQLDALYYVLELDWSRTGRLWHQQLATYLVGEVPAWARELFKRFGVNYSVGLGVTYMVDRIGQETRNYCYKYRATELDSAIKVLQHD
jgi:hypothetical protein